MLLVGFIDSLPYREHDLEGWFAPDHAYIQKTMKVKQPVYWQLLGGLLQRGLLAKRNTDQRGHQYRIEFACIEAYCRLSWVDSLIREVRRGLGLKARRA
jgi:hypothetical protein